jgi:hypothetical protein
MFLNKKIHITLEGKKEDRTEEGEDDEESEMRGGKRMGGCAHQ